MKPSPKYDFPVNVWPESAEHAGEAAALYTGIYAVTLNHSIYISFVPALDRSPPWPPELPDDVDNVHSVPEARRTVVALSSLSVSPDSTRAGHEELIPRPDGTPGVVFYVAPDPFDGLARELETMGTRFSGVHDAVPVSELADSALAKLLNDRIIPSRHLPESALRMLGRGGNTSNEETR